MRGQKIKLAPNRYRLRVYLGRNEKGSPIFESRTVHMGSREADEELRRMVDEVAGTSPKARNGTFADLLDRWLANIEGDHSPTTMREHRRLADKIIRPAIGAVRLSKLGAEDLDRLYRRLERDGLSPASVRRVHAVISGALSQGRKWKYVRENVARNATLPKSRDNGTGSLTAAEVSKILQAARELDPVLATLLTFAAVTGARRGELAALRWSSLDVVRGTVTVERSVYEIAGGGWGEKETKTGKSHVIALDDATLSMLAQHRESVDKLAASLGLEVAHDAFMFSMSPQGLEPIRPDRLSKFAARAAERLGLDAHLHMMRHWTSTEGNIRGYDAVTRAHRLGHKSPRITEEVYTHADIERDRALSADLARAIGLEVGAR